PPTTRFLFSFLSCTGKLGSRGRNWNYLTQKASFAAGHSEGSFELPSTHCCNGKWFTSLQVT
ncbi:unnamed protein product, partial [Linum tenue]